MGSSDYFMMAVLPFLIMATVVFGIVFAIVAVVEGKHTQNKSKLIKQVYLYLVSILTLLISVVSIGFLINTGLKSSVLTKAEDFDRRSAMPQGLYLSSEKTEPSSLACTTECELSQEQKTQIESWTGDFQRWQDGQDVTARRQGDLVGSLSLLIVAVPLFVIHYRAIHKEHRQSTEAEKADKVIRPTYFYIASFVGLGLIIVFGSMLANLLLKTYVFPKASSLDTSQNYPMGLTETSGITTIKNCADTCGLSTETVTAANEYETAYAEWQDRDQSSGRFQSQLALDLAYLLVAIPLFWYHWVMIRRENRSAAPPQQ